MIITRSQAPKRGVKHEQHSMLENSGAVEEKDLKPRARSPSSLVVVLLWAVHPLRESLLEQKTCDCVGVGRLVAD
jgi:hypothetical protein